MPYTFESLQERYDHYIERKRRIRAEALARIEEQVAEAVEIETLELSRALHEAYGEGMSKGELRRAIRNPGNAPAFRKLWEPAAAEFPDEATPASGRPRKNPETGEATKPAADKLVLDKEAKTLTLGELKWDLTFTGDDYGRLAPGWRPYRIWDSPEDRHLRSVGVDKFNNMVVDMTADWERE